MKYHNESVVRRISKELGCSQGEAYELFEDTKRFLYLCARYPKPFSPSARIDEGWHAFILHTRDYMNFCSEYIGFYIHHQPAAGVVSKEITDNQKATTLHYASEVFGELSDNWKYSVKKNQKVLNQGDCSDNSCGTSCESICTPPGD